MASNDALDAAVKKSNRSCSQKINEKITINSPSCCQHTSRSIQQVSSFKRGIRYLGPSMTPTLKHGRRYIVLRCKIARTNHIVKIEFDLKWLNCKGCGSCRKCRRYSDVKFIAKRIVAVGGEKYRGIIVPVGHVYVVGDNKKRSFDSRHFGPIPIESIIGRVIVFPMV